MHFLYWKSGKALGQAAQGGGWVTITGGVQKTCRCGTSGYGLVGMVLLGWWLDFMILEVFSNLWIYDLLVVENAHALWLAYSKVRLLRCADKPYGFWSAQKVGTVHLGFPCRHILWLFR